MKFLNLFSKCFFLLFLFFHIQSTVSSQNLRIDVKPHPDDIRLKRRADMMDSEIVTPVRMREDLQSVASSHFRLRRSISHDSFETSNEEFETPVYKINAFGKEMILRLYPDDHLIAPSFTTSFSWKNLSLSNTALKKCFYKGRVSDQPSSQVTVSICDGLTGSIYTDDHIYFIEPTQKNEKDFQTGNENPIPHSIQRRSISSGHEKRSVNAHGSSCGVNDARHRRRYLQTYKPSLIEDLASTVRFIIMYSFILHVL